MFSDSLRWLVGLEPANKVIIISNPPQLLGLFGSLSINVYGVFALVGVLAFTIFSYLDTRRTKLLDGEEHIRMFLYFVVFGVLGARALNIVTNLDYFIASPTHILRIWDGGLSLMGGMLAVIATAIYRTRALGISFWSYADLIATYAPMFQAIARLGCLFAGCCYGQLLSRVGKPSLALLYTHPASLAPSGQLLLPAQLQSFYFSVGIFIVLFALSRIKDLRPGYIFFAYLALEGFARGLNDMIRGGRQVINVPVISSVVPWSFTLSQVISLAVAVVGVLGLVALALGRRRQTR